MNDITHFSLLNILIWIVSFFLMEFPMRSIYLSMGGESLTKWYGFREFNIYNVIIGDLFYVLVGVIIAYRAYKYFFGEERNIFKFFMVFWIVQMIGDLTFYLIISGLPTSMNNKWIKFFKNYGKTSGLNAVLGDSIYIFVWLLTAYFIKELKVDILFAILFAYIFICSIIDSS
jgi:hypothetical protein